MVSHSGVTPGGMGAECPSTLPNFSLSADLPPGKERQGKKGNGELKKENQKREGEN